VSLGYPGLEPETSPLSGARSTTELIARAVVLKLYGHYTSISKFHATPSFFRETRRSVFEQNLQSGTPHLIEKHACSHVPTTPNHGLNKLPQNKLFSYYFPILLKGYCVVTHLMLNGRLLHKTFGPEWAQ
jgi:hypothetical protein